MVEKSNLPELKLGYAFEGRSDYKVIQILVERLVVEHLEEAGIEITPEASELTTPERGFGFLKRLHLYVAQLADDEVQIAVVVVDSGRNRTGEKEMRKELDKAINACKNLVPEVCIADGMAVREMEAWLLADEQALKRTFNPRGNSPTFNRYKSKTPESIQEPKELLDKVVQELTNNKLTAVTPRLHILADEIELDLLKKRCPAFDRFAANLVHCLENWYKDVSEN